MAALNRALLLHHYGIAGWDLPAGYLCPPIPGRADYLHHLADLLGGSRAAAPRGPDVRVLDIGVGANCVYPLIGASDYGWRFVGTDIDPVALRWARQHVTNNTRLAGLIELRLQSAPSHIFRGVVREGETFAASLCNPPFHASPEAAAAGTRRKVRNLGGSATAAPVLNFGGRSNELWCPGGEVAFVQQMIAESAEQPALCRWFTTLVSKRESLPALYRALRRANARDVRKIDLAHGQKESRIVAWSFERGG